MNPVAGAVKFKLWTKTFWNVYGQVENPVYSLVELNLRQADWFSICDMVDEALEDQ